MAASFGWGVGAGYGDRRMVWGSVKSDGLILLGGFLSFKEGGSRAWDLGS